MLYYRCKCGKHEAWGSDSPPLCAKCDECGTSLATGPKGHVEPKDHDFSMVTQVKTDEGLKPLTRCKYCYRTRDEIEKLKQPSKGELEKTPT